VLNKDIQIPDEFEIQISLTQSDIAHGVKGDCEHCPHALAIERSLREKFELNFGPNLDPSDCSVELQVTGPRARFYRDYYSVANAKGYWVAKLPPEVNSWIQNFDYNQSIVKPEPMEYSVTFGKVPLPTGLVSD